MLEKIPYLYSTYLKQSKIKLKQFDRISLNIDTMNPRNSLKA